MRADISAAAAVLAGARRVVVVPGYGVGVAQAQHALVRLVETLRRRGTEVVFALHPVAGRMPGQLNVLLDGAGVAWSQLRDRESAGFDAADVALVVGANDVVNPDLGVPVLPVTDARALVILTRSTGPGYAGRENPIFAAATVVCGDAAELLRETEEAVLRIPQAGEGD